MGTMFLMSCFLLEKENFGVTLSRSCNQDILRIWANMLVLIHEPSLFLIYFDNIFKTGATLFNVGPYDNVNLLTKGLTYVSDCIGSDA